jgi:hypothetical protein
MKDARTVRPYLSSGKSAGNLFHLWNHVDYLSPAYHGNLRVFVCTQKARNTQNCDLFHSRSMRMKTFCEFCGFCVRYYFLVSREGAKVFINVITRIIQIFYALQGKPWNLCNLLTEKKNNQRDYTDYTVFLTEDQKGQKFCLTDLMFLLFFCQKEQSEGQSAGE